MGMGITHENTADIDGNGYKMGMGISIALAAAVPYPGEATQITCKGQ